MSCDLFRERKQAQSAKLPKQNDSSLFKVGSAKQDILQNLQRDMRFQETIYGIKDSREYRK